MFRLFFPRPPLSTFARVDIELLLRRNVEVLGRHRAIRSDIVTDISELGLDRDGSNGFVDAAVAELSERLQINGRDLQWTVRDDDEFSFASKYSDDEVEIHRDAAADPLRTTIEVANQLAHHFWIGQAAPRPLDHHPRTTTLLPIAMGLGVLASTASLQESHWTAAGYSGWSMSRSGYYSAMEIGYALALMARLRGETSPRWMQSLRPDAKKTADAATKFFAKHKAGGGQLLFDAERIPGTDRSTSDLTTWLAGDDPAFAMAAAYALAKEDALPEVAVEPAKRLAQSKDREIAVLAIRLLGRSPAGDTVIDSTIRSLIGNRVNAIALAALHSASQRSMPIGPFQRRIEKLLNDPSFDLIPVVELIQRHAADLAPLSPSVCRQVELAIKFEDTEATSALLSVLAKMSSDPVSEVERCVRNPDTRKIATEHLMRQMADDKPNDDSGD
ncbi:hypothetical protein Poly51_02780 [Rubripirellula tenax]|uniref:Uncharacterized protein n=1 Tax=Rubripirellula tenax TaxID=2528015 RepID=A0A5C6FGM3_9BACT|nr:hypothetical protein [Rubripirellula tenax]TWU60005.1 hypothetical protein Poly51_02780 [Rubripirellula tenax]